MNHYEFLSAACYCIASMHAHLTLCLFDHFFMDIEIVDKYRVGELHSIITRIFLGVIHVGNAM